MAKNGADISRIFLNVPNILVVAYILLGVGPRLMHASLFPIGPVILPVVGSGILIFPSTTTQTPDIQQLPPELYSRLSHLPGPSSLYCLNDPHVILA